MKHAASIIGLTALGATVFVATTVGLVWYVYRGGAWERRRGFHGRYAQPVEPGEVRAH